MKWPLPKRDFTEWHSWFAWRPVRVDDVLVWLETVERRGAKKDGIRMLMDSSGYGEHFEYWEWEYRQ